MKNLINAKYVIIKGSDEDGQTTEFFDEALLEEVLNGDKDGNLWYGQQLHFLTEEEFRNNKETNPYHWKEFDAILLGIDKILVPAPQIVKRQFIIKDDDE